MTAATTSRSAGFLPTINGLCKAGDVEGGTGATIVHGSGRVLANGDVVVPLTVCGDPAVVRSSDKGKTWTAVATGGRSVGLEDILAGREGIVLGITDHVWSENLAVDDHDNLYFAYIRDGVHLMVSRDGGRSWRQLGFVTPPGLVHAIVVSVTARGRGEVALTYYATPDKGDAFGARGMNWRAWMTYSPDALAGEARVPQRADLARVGADDGRGDVRLLHDRADLPRVHGREVHRRRRRSAARSRAGPASTCPSSCWRRCASHEPAGCWSPHRAQAPTRPTAPRGHSKRKAPSDPRPAKPPLRRDRPRGPCL